MAEKLRKELEKKADELRDSIVLEYRAMVDKISESQFNRVKDLIGEETGKSVEMTRAVEKMKANLSEKFGRKFKSNWEELELSQSLAILEFSKRKNENDEKKWRPTAQSVEHQVLPLVHKKLVRKKTYILTQLMFQNRLIAELVPQVEQYREGFKELAMKNRQTQAQMETDRQKLQLLNNAINVIQRELAEKTNPQDDHVLFS